MSTPTIKKRKVEATEDESQADKYASIILSGFTVFDDKADFIKLSKDSPDLIAGLLHSSFVTDVCIRGVNLLPEIVTDMLIKRKSDGRIKSVTFPDKSSIKGDSLLRLIGCWTALREGYSALIWNSKDSSEMSALLMLDWSASTGPKDFEGQDKTVTTREVTTVFTKRTKTYFFSLAPVVLAILRVKTIQVHRLKEIVEALNVVNKVDQTYDPSTLKTLTHVRAAKKVKDIGRWTLSFLTTFEGAMLDGATQADRITAFCNEPTLEMVISLSIPKPYGKSIFDMDLKVVKKVPLAELTDEEIIISDLPIDANFFRNQKTSTLSVYVKDDSVGIKKGKSIIPLRKVTYMKASEYKDLMDTIVNSRATKKKEDDSDTSDSESEGEDVNATTF